jgi:MFS family permease
MGILADKLGLKSIFIFGLFLFSTVYFGMAMTSNLGIFIGLFFLYGLYAASTEGISKAWISNIIPKNEVATAIGTYSAFQSICAMLASALTGFVWMYFGADVAFYSTALVSFLVIIYMIFVPKPMVEPVS